MLYPATSQNRCQRGTQGPGGALIASLFFLENLPVSRKKPSYAVAVTIPGLYAGALALLGGKAKPDTLKDWCSGRRNAPRLVCCGVLRDQLLVRRATIDAALDSLAAYEFGSACDLRRRPDGDDARRVREAHCR